MLKGKGKGDGKFYQFLKNAGIQLPFLRSALPELLVVVLETLPVRAELFEAGAVNVF